MKQKTLQIAAALFAALGFAPQAFADTDILTAEQGYQKIKNMPENLGDYYFIIVDKDKDLMMTQGAAEEQRSNDYASYNYKAAWYMPSADPATDLSRVWTVEANNHGGTAGYGLRGALRPSHLMQPEGVNGAWAFRTKDITTTPNEWAQYLLAYNEEGEYWTIQNARYTNDGYVGAWDNVIEAGAEMAGNKQDAAMGRFVFYAITKGNFYLSKIANMYESLLGYSVAEGQAKEVYQEAIATAKNAVNAAGNDVESLDAALAALEEARQTYAKAAMPANGKALDVSFLMADAAVTGQASDWNPSGIVNNQQQYVGAPDDVFLNGSGSQTITGLCAGVYRLTAATRAQNANGAAILLNDATATIANVGDTGNELCNGWGWTTTPAVTIEESGSLLIGFSTNNGWANADDFKLEYLGSELLVKQNEALAEFADDEQKLMGDILSNSTADEATMTAYRQAIENAKSGISAAETVDAVEEALAQALVGLEEARQAYVCAANPKEGFAFDVTFLLKDAAVTEAGSAKWQNAYGESVAANLCYPSAPDNYIFVYNGGTNGKGGMYQEVALRPRGVYRLTAATRAENREAGGYIYLNDSRAEIGNTGLSGNGLGNGWGWTTTDLVFIGEDGKARIGFDKTGSTWVHADNFKLEYLGEGAKDVSLTVSAAGWATLMLPYAAELPEGLAAYTCAGTEDGNEDGESALVLAEASSLAPNTPYIIQGTPATYTFQGSGMIEQYQYTDGLLTGTYVQMPAVVGSYVLQNPEETGIGFYKVVEVIPTVGAFRAYMNAESADAAGINVSRLVLGDDDVTGIESALAGDGDVRVDVYSLGGILVRKGVAKSEALNGLQKGIYVVDGVKKAVK